MKKNVLPPMERHKRLIRVGGYCVAIGGSVLIATAFGRLGVPFPVQLLLLALWLLCLAGAALFVNAAWFRQLAKAVDALGALQVTDPDAYIEQLNALLQGQKNRTLQDIRLVNLGSAYAAKKDYRSAKQALEQVDASRLNPALRCPYYMNLAMTLFFLQETDAMLSVMDAQKALFDEYRADERTAQTIALLDIFAAVARRDIATAETLLRQSRRRWTDSESAAFYDSIERILAGNSGEKPE
ncbi:MAG: hypothetical protein IJQ25_04375 [Oscillibacter sp.]|nr:hypothetical protein [Oscillibacter sp.]